MKHDKQCGPGNTLFNWLCVAACVVPAVALAYFFRDSLGTWLPLALMLAVCGGMHFLMTRSGGNESDKKQHE
jgi:hypothetical protein